MKNEFNKAIDFFGLKIPLKNRKEIQKKYRELAMKYHPDMGGKEEDFKLLLKYKNLLEKNFYKLNSTYSKIEYKKEVFRKREKYTKNFLELTGYKVEKLKLSIFGFINLFIELIVLYVSVFIIKVVSTFCLFGILFILPLNFFEDFGPIVEPNYIYGVENKEAVSFFLKITVIYLIFLLLYSIIYHLVIKKKLIIKLQNNKLPFFLRKTIIYYFVLLYFSVFFINKIITITFI